MDFFTTLAGVRLLRFGIEAALAAHYGAASSRWMKTPVVQAIVGVLHRPCRASGRSCRPSPSGAADVGTKRPGTDRSRNPPRDVTFGENLAGCLEYRPICHGPASPTGSIASAAAAVPPIHAIEDNSETDVVVIGGGLTGCACAYAFAAPGVKVIVLEAERSAPARPRHRRASFARTSTPPFSRPPHWAYGFARASMWQAMRRASLDFAAALRRLRIRCDLAPQDLLIARCREILTPSKSCAASTRHGVKPGSSQHLADASGAQAGGGGRRGWRDQDARRGARSISRVRRPRGRRGGTGRGDLRALRPPGSSARAGSRSKS